MIGAVKTFSACFVFALLLSNCPAVYAENSTYNIGLFWAEGVGVTSVEAESEALGEMYDMLDDIENSLSAEETMVDYVIYYEGLVNPTTYEIAFYVVVEYDPH